MHVVRHGIGTPDVHLPKIDKQRKRNALAPRFSLFAQQIAYILEYSYTCMLNSRALDFGNIYSPPALYFLHYIAND